MPETMQLPPRNLILSLATALACAAGSAAPRVRRARHSVLLSIAPGAKPVSVTTWVHPLDP
jgi:hypothetical protein